VRSHLGLAALAQGAARPIRVLVVDDNDQLRPAVCECVSRLGYEVVEAADSATALQRLDDIEAGPVDIVLSDVYMPNLSGTALADIARQRWPHVKFLLMSGNAPDGLSRLYPLICKPFGRSDLARAMLDLLAAPGHAIQACEATAPRGFLAGNPAPATSST
jgi:CheY-like chemotaxis protein